MTEWNEDQNKYLTFFCGGKSFAISIHSVVQIIRMQHITEIPESPHYIKGVINLRGNMIPVIDMRRRLGMPEEPYSARNCIIVGTVRTKNIGFIVDEVDEVTSIGDQDISEPPESADDSAQKYVEGVRNTKNGMLLIIHADKLADKEETENDKSIKAPFRMDTDG